MSEATDLSTIEEQATEAPVEQLGDGLRSDTPLGALDEPTESDEGVQESPEPTNNDTIDADERHKGYLRQSDYTKGKQEIAREREALQAERAAWEQQIAYAQAQAPVEGEVKILLHLNMCNWQHRLYSSQISAQKIGQGLTRFMPWLMRWRKHRQNWGGYSNWKHSFSRPNNLSCNFPTLSYKRKPKPFRSKSTRLKRFLAKNPSRYRPILSDVISEIRIQ